MASDPGGGEGSWAGSSRRVPGLELGLHPAAGEDSGEDNVTAAAAVTLTAETDSLYISWPRKKLYVLLAQEKYIGRLFSALLGFDISQKLYALNDKLFAKFGLRFDIRLPSLYHVLGPPPEPMGDTGAASVHPQAAPASQRASAGTRGPRPDSGNLASGLLQKGPPRLLAHGRAPLAPTQTPEL